MFRNDFVFLKGFILFIYFCQQIECFHMFSRRFEVDNECSVDLQLENGQQTCENHQCGEHRDPIRIVRTHILGRICRLHYLKLSFSSYDQFLMFIENQNSLGPSIEEFFFPRDLRITILHIELLRVYALNRRFFLTINTLTKLGENKTKIRVLKMDIVEWHQSLLNEGQIFEDHFIDEQHFEQINLTFPCYYHPKQFEIVHWVLSRFLYQQDRSPCPTQIRLKSDDFKREEFVYPPFYPSKSSSTSTSIEEENTFPWIFFLQIFIPSMIILLIVIYTIYHCYRKRNV